MLFYKQKNLNYCGGKLFESSMNSIIKLKKKIFFCEKSEF